MACSWEEEEGGEGRDLGAGRRPAEVYVAMCAGRPLYAGRAFQTIYARAGSYVRAGPCELSMPRSRAVSFTKEAGGGWGGVGSGPWPGPARAGGRADQRPAKMKMVATQTKETKKMRKSDSENLRPRAPGEAAGPRRRHARFFSCKVAREGRRARGRARRAKRRS
jgi:hypothetical protein